MREASRKVGALRLKQADNKNTRARRLCRCVEVCVRACVRTHSRREYKHVSKLQQSPHTSHLLLCF